MRRCFTLLVLVCACDEEGVLVPVVYPDVGPVDSGPQVVDLGPPTCVSGGWCYVHPPATQGVGICRPGTLFCPEGPYGPQVCTSQGPVIEECDGADNDCDGQVDEDFPPLDCQEVAYIIDTSCSMRDGDLTRAMVAVAAFRPVDTRVLQVFRSDEETLWTQIYDIVPTLDWTLPCAHRLVAFIDELQEGRDQPRTREEAIQQLFLYRVDALIYADDVDEYASLGQVRPLGDIDLERDLALTCR